MAMLADTVGAILARHENPAFALPFRLLAEIKQPEGYEGVTDYLPLCDALTEVSGDLFLLTALRSGRVKVSSTEWTSSPKSQQFSPSGCCARFSGPDLDLLDSEHTGPGV